MVKKLQGLILKLLSLAPWTYTYFMRAWGFFCFGKGNIGPSTGWFSVICFWISDVRLELLGPISEALIITAGFAQVELGSELLREVCGSSGNRFGSVGVWDFSEKPRDPC